MAAIVAAIGKAVGSEILQSAFVKFLANVAITLVLAKLAAPKIPPGSLAGSQVMSRLALEYRKRVYGRAMVSGPIVYQNLTGTNGKYLWIVVALAGHKCSDLSAVWFDGDAIPKADIDWDLTASPISGTGDVSTAKWIGENSTKAVQLFYYLGDPDQVANAALLNSGSPITTDWTSSHRLRGVTYLIARLLYDEDTEEVWKANEPRAIKGLLDGALIYDPRLDSTRIIDPSTSPVTYGNGAHRFDDDSTWAWSDNSSLCAADYLTQVMGVVSDSINWPSAATAADDCDVLVSTVATSPVTKEKRFTCNGSLSMGDSHRDNLSAIQVSMDGRISYSQGQWRIRASVWKTPDITLTPDDLTGGITVRGSSPKANRHNSVRGFYIDLGRGYQAVEFPHATSATYLARDGGKSNPLDIELPLVKGGHQAQRIGFRILEQENNQKIIELPLSPRGALISIGDTINVDFPTMGWADGGNLLPYAEDFTQGDWSKDGSTITANTVMGPHGKLNGSLIANDGGAGNTGIFDFITITTGDTLFGRASVKAEDYSWVMVTIFGAGGTNRGRVFFDLVNGSIGSNTENTWQVLEYGMENDGNGWYDCWLVVKTSAETTATLGVFACEDDLDFTLPSSSGQGIYCSGTQLIQRNGDVPMLYHRTDGAAIATVPQTARVIEWKRNPDGTFTVVATEDYQTSYTDPDVGDYGNVIESSITAPTDVVPPPSNLAAGNVANGIQLTWTNPPAATYDFIDVYESLSNDWTATPMPARVARLRADLIVLPRDPGTTYYYWIRAIRMPALMSLRDPDNDISTITATAEEISLPNPVALSNADLADSSLTPTDSQVLYRLNANGTAEKKEGIAGSWTTVNNWLITGTASQYEWRFENDSGDPINASGSAAEDTWLPSDNTVFWGLLDEAPAGGELSNSNTARIRDKLTQEELDTATITMTAEEGA